MHAKIGWGVVAACAGLLGACGRGAVVGTASHPTDSPIPSPWRTVEPDPERERIRWWHDGVTFAVPDEWDVWQWPHHERTDEPQPHGGVELEGDFTEGVLPAGVRVMLVTGPAGEIDARALKRYFHRAQLEETVVNGVRAVVSFVESDDGEDVIYPSTRFAGVAIARPDDGEASRHVRIELTARSADGGRRALHALVGSLRFDEPRGDLPTAPLDRDVPERLGVPELERTRIPGTDLAIGLPVGWIASGREPFVFEVGNGSATLDRPADRAGDSGVIVRLGELAFSEPPEEGERWSIERDERVTTPAGAMRVQILRGFSNRLELSCRGSSDWWFGIAGLRDARADDWLEVATWSCVGEDASAIDDLFQRILASLERVD